MLRALLILAIPCTTLLAGMPSIEKNGFLGVQGGRLNLAEIPIAENAEKSAALRLAEMLEAADKGDVNAQARVGIMYYWGEGAPMDWELAQVWLRKASERGNAEAQAKLGAMCFLGQGAPRNLEESIKWFRMAAEQGEAYSQGCMGVMYAVGEGVPRDLVQAYVWLVQAQAGGDAEAAEPLEQVRNHLSPAELREAERLVLEARKSRSGD